MASLPFTRIEARVEVMLRSFERGAAKRGVKTDGAEEAEHSALSVTPSRAGLRILAPVTRSTSASLLTAFLALAACSPDATLPTLDVPVGDATEDARAPDAGADAAPDVQPDGPAEAAVTPDVPLDAPAEAAVTPDAAPPTDAALDTPAPDVQVDVPVPDAAVMPDAPADAPADRAVADAPADVVVADVPATDAQPDVAPAVDAGPPTGPCTFTGSVRCYGGDRWSCIGGMWMPDTCGAAPRGGASLCTMDSCYVCRVAASGAGCAPEPLCTTDADCLGMGLARCIAGLCSRRSSVVCVTDADCVRAWGAVPSGMQCNERLVAGGTAFRCENPAGVGAGTSAGACTSDATCPRGYSCYASDRVCHPL